MCGRCAGGAATRPRALYRLLDALGRTELLRLQPGNPIGQRFPFILHLHARTLGVEHGCRHERMLRLDLTRIRRLPS